jgi:hypothetical protein
MMKSAKWSYLLLIGTFALIVYLRFVVMNPAPTAQQSTVIVPTEIAGTTYYAATPLSITLDGNFTDWNGIPYATVTDGPQPSPSSQDNSMQFAAVADSQNLYFSVLVTDRNIITGKHDIQYWNEDSVEIYLNATGDLSLTGYTSGVAQINIPAVNIGRPIDQTVVNGINSENVSVRAVVVATEHGYAIEAAVPLVTDVWNIVPSDGTSIGFQIQLNSASQTDRDVKLSWSALDKTADQSYRNPSLFGQLVFTTFSGSPPPTIQSTAIPVGSPAPASAVSTSNFKVQGSTIYDPQGNEFIAKGVNVNGYNWVWQRKTVADVDLITNCWKFNLVRVNSFLFVGDVPYPQFTDNNNLDEIVNTFTQRGIVVVFEGHDRIGRYYRDNDLKTLVDWFTDLANRYKDNPYVWFDVMNEPGGQYLLDEANWLMVHREVIRGIRDVANAENIVIVEGAYGGQDAGTWDDQPVEADQSAIMSLADDLFSFDGKTYDNIVFSIHTYDQWNFGDEKMADYFDRIQQQNLAMIVGEYGVQTNADTQKAVESLFNTAVPRRIGRVVWHWDGGDLNDLTNASHGGGWEINDCSNPTNLSWLGQKVWDDNHTF